MDEDAAGRSIARLILADRATLGFVRLLVTVAALYSLASIAIMVTRGRWLRSISTTGIEADDASDSNQTISELEARLRRAREERDEANTLLWEFLHG